MYMLNMIAYQEELIIEKPTIGKLPKESIFRNYCIFMLFKVSMNISIFYEYGIKIRNAADN